MNPQVIYKERYTFSVKKNSMKHEKKKRV